MTSNTVTYDAISIEKTEEARVVHTDGICGDEKEIQTGKADE